MKSETIAKKLSDITARRTMFDRELKDKSSTKGNAYQQMTVAVLERAVKEVDARIRDLEEEAATDAVRP